MEVIKRYSNRKLYSTQLNTYVKLGDILGYVLAGRKFQVIDNESNKDITKQTILKTISKIDVPQKKLEALIRGEL